MSDLFRTPTPTDSLIGELDRALNNIFCPQKSSRPYPPSLQDSTAASKAQEAHLSASDRRLSADLMRVNHAGEMAAQALYQGQSLTTRDPELSEKLKHASIEESDHLNWCRNRLQELDEHPSLLDPLWYAGSFAIGMAAGLAGDRWNLGFLAETEHQVVRHLDSHLQQLSAEDLRSRSIIEQMKIDEQKHADLAEHLGATKLPEQVKYLMKITSKVMTSLAKRI